MKLFIRTTHALLIALAQIACLSSHAVAGESLSRLFEDVSQCGDGGIEEARRSARDHANSTGENLGHHSMELEERAFVGEFTPPECPEGMQGSYVYGLALFSDDGCDLKIDGHSVHQYFRRGQALPRLGESFHNLPVLLQPGRTVEIELNYSNVRFITKGDYADIDGVTLYLYKIEVGLIPDANRDGVIDERDKGWVTPDNPWRWWVNDDRDKGGTEGITDGSGDTPSGNFGNSYLFQVDGMRDLVDFFPLYLDLGELLKGFPPERCDYRLSHPDGAIHYVEVPFVNPRLGRGAAAHLVDIGVATALAGAKGHSTRKGTKLTPAFLNAVAAGRGLVLCEGVLDNDKPLYLEIEPEGGEPVWVRLSLRINRVEAMYRHLNLRDQLPDPGDHGNPGKLPTRLGDPGDPYPDALTNGKYFVHVHGFANDADTARGGHAEIFKRLHQMGSRARFVGVSWHGDTSLDYHHAVRHAFLTGDVLATRLPNDGGTIIAGHSLGNMVVSQAIEYGGLKVHNYFMINAATPIEAYDPGQTRGEDGWLMEKFMTEKSWQEFRAHRSRLFASDWWRLFAAGDHRRKLSWHGRFADKVPLVATNFYSTGEDVVANPDKVFTVGNHLLARLKEFNFQKHSWVAQEISKGSDVMGTVLRDTHAGWHFNENCEQWKSIRKQANWEQRIDELVSTALVKQHPFYEPFAEIKLYDPAVGSAVAADKNLQYRLLATAIPAQSYAVAANAVEALRKARRPNIDMMDLKTDGQWPRGDGLWLHGDFRAVALCYVHTMYAKMIELGQLDQ